MNKLKAVIWDLDDTLLDTTKMILAGWSAVLTELFPQLPEQALDDWMHMARYTNSHDVITPLRIVLNIHQVNGTAEQLQQAEQLFWERFIQSARLRDGALEALAYFNKMGITQGLVTNGQEELQMAKVNSMELGRFFDPEHIVIYRGNDEKGKPMPEGLLECVGIFGVSPHQCCYVGDRLTVVIAANMAQMVSVQITAPEARRRWEVGKYSIEIPKITIDRPDQLIALFA